MNPLLTSGIVLVCIFGGAVAGILLRRRLPDEHLSTDTKEIVKLVMGIVGTMTGMVLGLLVASAKSSFDGQRNGVSQLAANVVVLDRSLKHYGPESQDARASLRASVADLIHRMWPDGPRRRLNRVSRPGRTGTTKRSTTASSRCSRRPTLKGRRKPKP